MLHDITQFGYLAAYGGDPTHKFTAQFPKRVAVSFDTIDTDLTADFRILVQCEPPKLYRDFHDMVVSTQQNFDLILAYDPRLLLLPQAQEFIPVGSWVNDATVEKTKEITYIMSSKIWTDEHRMRFQILRELEGIDRIGQFDFLMHRSPPHIKSKDRFFSQAMFHIACENQIMDNMFTEKLLDCLRTFTIPIYYGCTNIEKYFNVAGIFRFNTIEGFRHIMRNITPETYSTMLPHVMENYEKSRPYWDQDVYQRVEAEIIKRFFATKYPK
jgi:hypothetical protein